MVDKTILTDEEIDEWRKTMSDFAFGVLDKFVGVRLDDNMVALWHLGTEKAILIGKFGPEVDLASIAMAWQKAKVLEYFSCVEEDGGDCGGNSGPRDCLAWAERIEHLLAEHRQTQECINRLVKAVELQLLNFQRQRASGRFLGDDDREAWVAMTGALEGVEDGTWS